MAEPARTTRAAGQYWSSAAAATSVGAGLGGSAWGCTAARCFGSFESRVDRSFRESNTGGKTRERILCDSALFFSASTLHVMRLLVSHLRSCVTMTIHHPSSTHAHHPKHSNMDLHHAWNRPNATRMWTSLMDCISPSRVTPRRAPPATRQCAGATDRLRAAPPRGLRGAVAPCRVDARSCGRSGSVMVQGSLDGFGRIWGAKQKEI